MSDFLSKIADAKANLKTPWYEPGNYRVKITKCDSFQSKQSESTMVVVEGDVVAFEPREGTSPTAFVPGSKVAWLPDMAKKPTAGNLKKFALEVYKQLAINKGKDPTLVQESDITPDMLRNVFGPESWAVGLTMNVVAFTTKTKAKTDFTVVTFTAG